MSDLETLLRTELHDALDGVTGLPSLPEALVRGHDVRRRRLVAAVAGVALLAGVGTVTIRSFVGRDAVGVGPVDGSPEPSPGEMPVNGYHVLEQFARGDFKTVRRYMDAATAEELTESRLRTGWEQVTSEIGAFVTTTDERAHGSYRDNARRLSVYEFTARFATGHLSLQLVHRIDERGVWLVGMRLHDITDVRESELDPLYQRVNAIHDDLNAGKFESVWKQFDDAMKEKLSADKLRLAWESYAEHVGVRGGWAWGHSGGRESTGVRVVELTYQYDDTTGMLQVSFDTRGRIAGFYLLDPLAFYDG